MDVISNKNNKGSKPKHKTYSIEEIASVRSRNDYILTPMNGLAPKPKTFSQIKHEKRKKEQELLQTKCNPSSLKQPQPDVKHLDDHIFTGQNRLSPDPSLPTKTSNNPKTSPQFDYSASRFKQRRSSAIAKDYNICPNCGYQACYPPQTHVPIVSERSLPTLEPDALASKLTLGREPYLDICGGRLTLTPDSCIDALSCMCGVKFLLYHCVAPPDDANDGDDWDSSSSICSLDDYQHNNIDPLSLNSSSKSSSSTTRKFNKMDRAPDLIQNPCSCASGGSNAKLFMRWSGLLLISLFCPCLCLYPPLKALSRAFRRKRCDKKEPQNLAKLSQIPSGPRFNTQKKCFECPKCSHSILIDSKPSSNN